MKGGLPRMNSRSSSSLFSCNPMFVSSFSYIGDKNEGILDAPFIPLVSILPFATASLDCHSGFCTSLFGLVWGMSKRFSSRCSPVYIHIPPGLLRCSNNTILSNAFSARRYFAATTPEGPAPTIAIVRALTDILSLSEDIVRGSRVAKRRDRRDVRGLGADLMQVLDREYRENTKETIGKKRQ